MYCMTRTLYWLIFGLFGLITALILAVLLFLYASYQLWLKPNYPQNHSGQVNILILGKGDQTHQAADLTDTMLLTSIDLFTNRVKLLSLPRDLWDDKLEIKINSLYYWGKKYQPQNPLNYVAVNLQRIIGVPIHYVIVVDFNDLKQVVDDMGGVWVNVKQGFDDYKYPIKGKENAYPISARYMHVSFEPGWQKMDGERALIFVRSRHAQGEEGTDFARARRQQLLIKSIINQLTSQTPQYLRHPNQTYQMFNNWWRLIDTNLPFPTLINLALRLGINHLNHKPLQLQTLSFDLNSSDFTPQKIQVGPDLIWVLKPTPYFFTTLNRFLNSDNVQ